MHVGCVCDRAYVTLSALVVRLWADGSLEFISASYLEEGLLTTNPAVDNTYKGCKLPCMCTVYVHVQDKGSRREQVLV